MKNISKNGKIFCLIVLILLIFTIFPASGIIITNQNDKITTNDESSEWKSLSYCIIRGEHYGNVWPQYRIGFALTITIEWAYDNIELIKGNEIIPISELNGYGFFGYIEYYNPRYPAVIFGFLLFCQYKEDLTCL